MKLTLNLLPPEVKKSNIIEKRKSLIIKGSIGLLVVMIILTTLQFGLPIINSTQIGIAEKDLEASKSKVTSFKDQESLAVVLKSRLSTIKNIAEKGTPSEDSFNALLPLLPTQTNILSLALGKEKTVALNGQVDSTTDLDTLFRNLTDPAINDKKISSVKLGSLSKNALTGIKFDLSIVMAK